MKKHIPIIHKSLQLYLANKDTEFILFKPIRNNVSSSFTQLGKLVSENYSADDQIIVSCPSQEEVAALINSLFNPS